MLEYVCWSGATQGKDGPPMLLKVIALVGAVISGIFALVGWSLARVSHASDELIRRLFEEHEGAGDTQHDL
jgi:hypothetical protein